MAKKWLASDMPSVRGQLAVVTGASSGLGLETAIGLAAAGARVILACRNPLKAETAMRTLRARVPDADAELAALDLANLASIQQFAEQLQKQAVRLDLLCNNAGVMATPFTKTVDGFEMQMGTNHFGHFALTGRLLPLLKQAPQARIVTVASLAHNAARSLPLDDLSFEKSKYNKALAYSRSKLANLLFTRELARHLSAHQLPITAVAAHPGYSATNIVGSAAQSSILAQHIFNMGNTLIAQPAERGVLPTLYAATMPHIRPNDYIGPMGPLQFRGYPGNVGSSDLARNSELATALWRHSEQVTTVCYPF